MNILLVDDDSRNRNSLSHFIRNAGHFVVECGDAYEVLRQFSVFKFQLILSSVEITGKSGLELLQSIRSMPNSNTCEVVLFSGRRDAETVIAALRSGAYDYILKPIDPTELSGILNRVAERQQSRENQVFIKPVDGEGAIKSRKEVTSISPVINNTPGTARLCAGSESMKKVMEIAQKYSQDRSISIVIEGETGVGKDVVARLIHDGYMAENRPFIDVNCAALTPSLFESELFGYEAGAFTGGLQRGHKGKFDIANGGTLFLDEIGEIPLGMQSKLLRVIEGNAFYRVGGIRKVMVDVRIICATNVDLKQAVAAGTFRKDLYYRLRVGHLFLPPLRHRPEDILPLAEVFLREYAQKRGKQFKRISHAAQKMLTAYSWPGNVRELRNVIEWATVMYDEIELKTAHLEFPGDSLISTADTKERTMEIHPENFSLPDEGFDLGAFTGRIIAKAVDLHKGNKSAAARFLGITRRALCCRLDRVTETDKKLR